MDAVIEVEIGAAAAAGTYTVRVLKSLSGGEPTAVISLDIDAILDVLPRVEESVLASSVSARRVMSTQESELQSIGVRLFDTVFAGKIGEAYRSSAAVAGERGIAPQLTLHLTAPKLAALPWEALFDSEARRYVSRKDPLVRRVGSSSVARTSPVVAPLRILGMVSSPRGLQVLDVEAEKERLTSALAEHIADGRVELTWLEQVTWSGLHGMLLSEQWHVLHFIGHGGYDVQADEGLLAFVGTDGRAEYVTASSVADLLNESEGTPRLVVLNSCQSGATGTTDLFSGTAASLVHSGINAVVAMQFAVSDPAALAFAGGFYTSLVTGRRIDEAVRSGRIGILGIARDTLEWITPVLYLAGDDSSLMDPAVLVARPERRGAATEPDRPSATHMDARGGGDADPTSTATAADVGPPARGAGPPRADAAPQGGRRTPLLIGGAVAGVIVIGGLAWGAGAIWGTGPAHTRASTSAPPSSSTPTPTPTPTPTVLPPVDLSVPGAAAWTATGVECETGDILSIVASGTILHDPNPASIVTPDGLADPYFHPWNAPGLPDSPTAGLIGSLDQTQPFVFVGSHLDYVCPRDGAFFLGINDIGLDGNSGYFRATITRTDNPSE